MVLRIVIGQFYPAKSFIHQLDPRIKLTLLLAWIALAFVANTIQGLGLLLLLLLAACIASKIPAGVQVRAALPLLYLLIFPLVFNVLMITSGDIVFTVGPLVVSTDGLFRSCFMTLRLLLLFWSAVLLTLSTSSIAICDAVASMLSPFQRFGLPSFEIAMMTAVAMRFIPVLADTYERIRQAHQARGSALGQGSLSARVKALAPVLVALFAQSFRMSEELAEAMESRCYNGSRRTHYHQLQIKRGDIWVICITLVFAAVLITLRILGY